MKLISYINTASLGLSKWIHGHTALINAASAIIVGVSLIIAFLVGFTNPITEHHGFRQTQVAITIFWMVEQSIFDYLTPVGLPPWQVPRELPIFQVICAIIVKLTHFPVDQVGRLVSFSLFLLTIPLFKGFLRDHNVDEFGQKIGTCMFALSPTYIYWSRSVMIESLALLLSLLYIRYLYASCLRTSHNMHYIACWSFGILAALVKVTTFFPAALVANTFCLITSPKVIFRYQFYLQLVLIASSILLWGNYATSIRTYDFVLNESGQGISYAWVSDTFTHIKDKNFFKTIYWEIYHCLLPSALLLLMIVFSFIFRSNLKISFIFFISFLSTILIFANLYYVHDYYIFGSGYLLIGAISIPMSQLIRRFLPKAHLIIIPIFIALFSFNYFSHNYFRIQRSTHQGYSDLLQLVNERSPPTAIGLVVGRYLDPTVPYYIQRKCVTIGDYRNFPDPFQNTLNRIATHCSKHDQQIHFALFPKDENYDSIQSIAQKEFDLVKVGEADGWLMFSRTGKDL